MKSLLRSIFFNNWQRKLVAILFAMVIWMLVNHSMTTVKIIRNIPVKIINLPENKTVEGLQPSGFLSQKINLSITGNKSLLENLSGSDFSVVIDAEGKEDEFVAMIDKSNLVPNNPDLDLTKNISKVVHKDFIIKLSELMTTRVPIFITAPIGEAPRGYQFLDIWPYQLYITVSGPQKTVADLKSEGIKLTFNLDDISQNELNAIQTTSSKETDIISFFVPEDWKKVHIPSISNTPLKIDDPHAKALKIDFIIKEQQPIREPIPVQVFFPSKHSKTINPGTYKLTENEFLTQKNQIFYTNIPLYAHGVSRLFLDSIRNSLQIVIVPLPETNNDSSKWSVQFILPHDLEDKYVTKTLSETSDTYPSKSKLQEEYLRIRFRSFMNQFRIYTENNKKLNLSIKLKGNLINVSTDTSEKPSGKQ
ncbi:MAG TPA: hypothetical protein P5048_04120 [Chlamydiales bacterium]|mgnify:CR=1 FL=1|nr:hypothetical protein [Chlamydiales bacterium]